ncbi:LysM peptidoglycan-binding domain-containing protein [Phenylobacterium aquaticum]|uniref:LysM peptidoglycan-binding domain-containing protein n=1 Tax=Phenylobacterium aquaticum TaxID=1763816 RepID=UPI0026F17EE8|nr:LysM peptidoglycan-binding domain-containing protein [Phenylobacterium aquaticum]
MTLYPSRLVLILLAASALTACSTYEPFADQPTEPARPNFPIRTPVQPPADMPQAPAQDMTPAPQTSPLPPVESRPLDAPAAPAPSTYQPQAPAYQPPAYQPPVMQTVTKLTVTGKVVTVGGPPKTHKVKSGDNLDAIARDFGTTRKQLAEDNDLKSPFRIHPGDVLKGPSTEAKAYVVGQGDTLYAIAKRFNVTGQALADANDITIHTPLNSGKKLILPDGYKDKGPIKVETQVQIAGGTPRPAQPYPSQTYPSQTYPATPQPPPDQTPAPAQPARTTSVVTTTTKLSVTGKVVEIEGPAAVHVVEKGDAVDAIARGFDMSRQEFVKLNKLKEPYNIHPGEKLKGPPQTLKAYVIGSGDTLALVAKRFNVTPKALAAANDIKPTAALKPGKKLTLPEGFKDKGPIKETTRTVTETPAPYSPPYTPPPYAPPTQPQPQPQPQLPSQPQPYRPGPTTPKPTGPAVIPPSASELTESQISALGRGRFQWPLRGDIISDFGPKGTGQRNDGLNIRARAGDPVRAAASGDVVYAGDQVPGFGNLVLIKHADGWVTAYGHLARVDVKMQQKVVQGQQIGQAGSSGGVSEPQLHFEVRYAPSANERAKPVDPQLVLAK